LAENPCVIKALFFLRLQIDSNWPSSCNRFVLGILKGSIVRCYSRRLPRDNNVKATTLRFTNGDLEVLAKLEELTGLRRNQIIRAALRIMLRKIEETK
jgi:hypothetical protein